MIDHADADIREWLEPAVEGGIVTFAPPAPKREGAGVSVYLVELFDAPAARGIVRPQFQVGLRYLVTAWAETHQLSHELLGRALVAASERPEVEVDVAPASFELWLSLGVKPQAAFFLRVVARQRNSTGTGPLLRRPWEPDQG